MTTQDWIGILWLIAITIFYAYAYHIRTQHIRHKEHKENSRQILQDFIKAENTKKNNKNKHNQHTSASKQQYTYDTQTKYATINS